ncbi:ATP-binding protein [Bacillus solitudinis]|uniref:ATP-binding protein n=1 Tax=Bacillus solitudinis TaxID=2014074 RepID=UPI000C24862F|nr:ATP-binding protein [Bacillus solitudinis]
MQIQLASLIEESHNRCKYLYGLKTTDSPGPKSYLEPQCLEKKLIDYQELLTVTRHFIQKTLQFMEGTPMLIAITDEEGYILSLFGDQAIKAMIESLGITIGGQFKEEETGTNSISMALKLKKPVMLIGKDHYQESLHQAACYSAPFFYETNQLTGTITIMTSIQTANNFHLGLLSSAVDSIERELTIRKQNKRLNILTQSMINSTHNGILIVDSDGIINDFNPFLERMTGISREEAVGESIDRIQSVREFIRKSLYEKRKIENLEVSFFNESQKSDRTCLIDVFPIEDDEKKLIGVLGQFRDITERIALEKQVIANEKLSAIGKLGAGLAHEIRNPLTSVIGFIQLLKQNNTDEKSGRFFNIISQELERIKSLVTQFVLMAKPNQPLQAKNNIVETIKETVELLKGHANLQNVNIHVDLQKIEKESLLFDKSQIKQVLINLIQNSIESMGNGGNVYITVKEESIEMRAGIQIEIKDEGEGMSEQQVNEMFTPFYTSKESGLGLGLSICKRIMDAHKGEISAFSKKFEGTTFYLFLPF